jgi:hypothetical protein
VTLGPRSRVGTIQTAAGCCGRQPKACGRPAGGLLVYLWDPLHGSSDDVTPASAARLPVSVRSPRQSRSDPGRIRCGPRDGGSLRTFPSYVPFVGSLRRFPSYVPFVRFLRRFPSYVPFVRSLRTFPSYVPFVRFLRRFPS